MPQYYDAELFREILESIQGIKFIREERNGEVVVWVFEGLKAKAVLIDVSYGDINPTLGKMYLEKLGLDHLKKSLFP
jgi:hypothetical protein